MRKLLPTTISITCFTLLLLLLQSRTVSAQTVYEERPLNEREVCFLYAEFGLPNSDKVKAVVFTSYIYRYKYKYGYSHPVLGFSGFRTRLINQFNKKINEIVNNEFNAAAALSNQVMYKPHYKIEWAFSDGHIAKATGPELYLTLSSPTALLEKVREKVIQQYRERGYQVFQVTFDEHYDDGVKVMRLEHVSKLSPLYVETYHTGSIKRLAQPYQKRNSSAGSGSGGLVIEDSGAKPATSKKSSTSSAAKSRDDAYWKHKVAMNRMQAESFEMEGNRLYKQGTMFYMSALKSYQAAQQLYPTDRVKAKIDEINSYMALGKAVNDGLDNLEIASADIRKTLDAAGIPRFRATQFSYSGNFKSFGKQSALVPWSTAITYGFYRLLAMEAGIFYAQSPVYNLFLTDKYNNKFYVQDEEGNRVGYKAIQAYQSTAGISLSIGLAMPIKSFLVYGLYGGNLPYANVSAVSLTDGYVYSEVKDDLQILYWQGKAKLGVNFKVPKSRIAFGAHYTLNWIDGDKIQDKDSPYNRVQRGNYEYQVGGSVDDAYKFNQFGISLFILSKNPQ